jgi:hypothetical protein
MGNGVLFASVKDRTAANTIFGSRTMIQCRHPHDVG